VHKSQFIANYSLRFVFHKCAVTTKTTNRVLLRHCYIIAMLCILLVQCTALSCQVCDSVIQRQERQTVAYIQCLKENSDLFSICWRW